MDITAILDQFENRADVFHLYEVSAQINQLATKLREVSAPIDLNLIAEQIAFEVIPDYRQDAGGWGTYYGPVMEYAGATVPDVSAITADVITYWITRARGVKHPLLRQRYADVAWDFSRKLFPAACHHEIPRLMIDATVELILSGRIAHPTHGIRDLRRALDVALSLNDADRIGRVRDTIIAYEDKVGADEFIGLWGFSYDLLIGEKKRVQVTGEQTQKIIADLESRIVRLAGSEKLDLHRVEMAAQRLANYYRRKNQHEDVRRVMSLFAAAAIRNAKEKENGLVAASWLKRVHDALLSFGLNQEAEALQPHYRESAQQLRDAMKPVEISVPIDQAALEEFISGFLLDETDAILQAVVGHFLPDREQDRQGLEKLMKGRILEMFGSTLVDSTGRAISSVGPLEDDPEGNLVHHVASNMNYGAFFLRAVILRLVATRRVDAKKVIAFLSKSEIFDPDREKIIEIGLDAYFSQNWLVAIHLLIPQIENVIRRFVDLTGGASVKKGKNGGLLLRNLDELLRDQRVEYVYGPNGTFYLRVLLTDQRGWNIRNDVAHGITITGAFDSRTADRLFHALLLVGSIRRKPHTESAP